MDDIPLTNCYIGFSVEEGEGFGVLPQIAYMLELSLVFFMIAIWQFRFD